MMKRHPVLSSIVLLGFAVGLFFWTRPAPSQASAAAAPAATPTGPVAAVPQYGTCKASSDGIGKTYHGREISHVMGHPGIGWLERTEREKEDILGLEEHLKNGEVKYCSLIKKILKILINFYLK